LILNVGCGLLYVGDVRLDVQRTLATTILGDAHSLPFRDGAFNRILCMEVLEHLESPSKGVMEMRRVLKEDGMLVVSVPNITEWRRILSINRHPTSIHCVKTTHRQAWDAIAFHHLADLSGLEVVRVDWFDHYPRKGRYTFLNPIFRRLLPSSFYYTHMRVSCTKTRAKK
jgi:SAM-dependent methyltransferase